MTWFDRLPTGPIAVFAVLMLFAPFVPEPHLWQKAKMLAAGTLSKPIDIFDVFWHLLPSVLLVIKLVRGERNPEADS